MHRAKRYLFTIIAVALFSILGYSVQISGKAETPVFAVNLNYNGTEKEIPYEVYILLKHLILSDWSKEGQKTGMYVIGSLRHEGTWGIGTIVPADYDIEKTHEDHVSNYQVANATSFFYTTHGGSWNVALEDSSNLQNVLDGIPENGLLKSVKDDIRGTTNSDFSLTQFGQSYTGYKFPYGSSDAFTFFRTPEVWHSTGNRAIDFGQSNNVNVLATAPGYITSVCKNASGQQAWIKVKTEDPNNPGQYLNGEELLYLHFAKSTMPSDIQQGQVVTRGQVLGKLVNSGDESNFPCPMWSTARHVHIVLPYKPFLMDNYTFSTYSNGSLRLIDSSGSDVNFNGSTQFYSSQGTGSCAPVPSQNWIISNDCEINSNINFDFVNYHIMVENGAKLIIKDGAKIY